MTPRALVCTMRLHAAALAALLLTAPAAILWPDAPIAPPGAASPTTDGPLDRQERPPPMSRFDARYVLNDTSVRVPTLPEWPADEGCVLLETWGGSTIVRGGLRADWTPALFGGAEIMTLRVEAPGGVVFEQTGAAPIEVRLDGLALHEAEPTKITLRAADRAPPFVRQQGMVRMGWEMTGGPVAADNPCDGEKLVT